MFFRCLFWDGYFTATSAIRTMAPFGRPFPIRSTVVVRDKTS